MQTSESVDQLMPALVAARLAMPKILKDAQSTTNRYATLGAVLEAVMPALLANGLMLVQGQGRADEAGAETLTRILHVSGQWVETVIWLPLLGNRVKGGDYEPISPRAAGSTNSYGRRYGVSGALALWSEDDDGESATPQRAAPRAAQAGSAAPPAGPDDAPLMPFGHSKGQLLSDQDTDDLLKAQAWARSKGKFQEFQDQVDREVRQRSLTEDPAPQATGAGPGAPGEEYPPLEDGEDDGLPF